MITRWMPCAPVCIIKKESVIRRWIRGTAVVREHLGNEMVAEGMKMATIMFGGSLHVFTHIYM